MRFEGFTEMESFGRAVGEWGWGTVNRGREMERERKGEA